MDHIHLQNNGNLNFTESNNAQQQSNTAIPPEKSSSNTSNSNYNVDNIDFSVMKDDIFSTPHANNDYSDQQSMHNENTTSSYSTVASLYDPQYDHPQQPIVDTSSPLNSFNMTTINPSHSEILSFDIPGFKIIIIPTSSQQDNTYLNYFPSDVTNNYQAQFTQFQQ
ncbi:hypothetical protein C1645_874376 [Glomus cerebriforme]|uniref:Uncharacterized protein n=1 Tax=Glomus cerebriforme TaxID=658196 RepID=A0A397T7Z8_9GLOM|nr:hypothetical protein C1645_874376 [Glomus cerebriforme]